MPEGESVGGAEPGPDAGGDVGSLGEDESDSDDTVDPVGNSSVGTTSLLASDCAVFSLSAIVIRLGLALESGPALEAEPELVSESAGAAERGSTSELGLEFEPELEFELDSDTLPCPPSGLVDRSSGRRAVSGHSSNDPSSPDSASSAVSADESPAELVSAAAVSAVSEEEGDEEEDPVDRHADDSSTDASASSLETQSRTVSAAREVIPLESDSDSIPDFDSDPVFTESDGCSAAEFRPALESADPIADDGVN
ncbi:hypothetical protein C480_08783 [Natrialba aegyptia DSM 13077]|uniref:Uncharacterized protein n=1 Tax=Natrialba aegyptia DSM 13077 TaxID=1227491 RepID=M0B8N9_9EURY|nr:hypothetical protein C480_08783 [Natrialba aegyptia DSM 13077]